METYRRFISNQNYDEALNNQKQLKFREALQLYSEALALYPGNTKCYENRSVCLLEIGRYQEALGDAKKFLSNTPTGDGVIQQARCHLAMGDIISAEESFKIYFQNEHNNKQDFAKDYENFKILKKLMEFIQANYDHNKEQCLEVIENAIRIAPACMQLKLQRVECLAVGKKYQEAEFMLTVLQEHDEYNDEIFHMYGIISFYKGDLVNAKNYFDAVLQCRPNYKKSSQMRYVIEQIIQKKELATYHFERKQYSTAIKIFQTILKLSTEDNKAIKCKINYNISLIYKVMQNFLLAIQYCSEAILNKPRYYRALLLHAECSLALELYYDALKDYLLAYEIQQDNSLLPKFMEVKAKFLASHICENNLRIAQIITNIGIKNAEGENYKSAIENFTNAINLYPLEIALYEWRAKCYMFSGQYDLAHNDYIKITLLTGNTPEEILKPIGLCCMMNDDSIGLDLAILELSLKPNSFERKLDISYLNDVRQNLNQVHYFFNEKNYNDCYLYLNALNFHTCLTKKYKLMKAKCLMSMNEYSKSEEVIDEILKEEKHDIEAITMKCLVLFQRNDLDGATNLFECCTLFYMSNDTRNILFTELKRRIDNAIDLFRRDLYHEANIIFSELMKKYEHININLHNSMKLKHLECLFKLKNYSECIVECKEAVKTHHCIEYNQLLDRAKTHLKLEKNELKNNSSKGESSNSDSNLKNATGITQLNAGNYEAAITHFTEAIELLPNCSIYYSNRADCYIKLNQFNWAIEDAEYSIFLNTHCFQGYASLINCYLKLGNVHKAKETLVKLRYFHNGNKDIRQMQRKIDILKESQDQILMSFKNEDYHGCIQYMKNATIYSRKFEMFDLIRIECMIILGKRRNALDHMKLIKWNDCNRINVTFFAGLLLYFDDDMVTAYSYMRNCLVKDQYFLRAAEILQKIQIIKKCKIIGLKFYHEGKYQNALEVFAEATHTDKNNFIALSRLYFFSALCKSKLLDHKQCISDCQKSLKYNASNINAEFLLRKQLQILCTEKGQVQNIESITCMAKNFMRKSKMKSYMDRAYSQMQAGNFNIAIEESLTALKCDANFVDAYIVLAKCHIYNDDIIQIRAINEKLSDLKRLHFISDENQAKVNDMIHLGNILNYAKSSYSRHLYSLCIEYIDKAFDAVPLTRIFNTIRTECLILVGRLYEAKFNLNNSSLRIEQEIYYLLGLWYYQEDYIDRALHFFSLYKGSFMDTANIPYFIDICTTLIELNRKFKLLIMDKNDMVDCLKIYDDAIWETRDDKLLIKLYYQRANLKFKFQMYSEAVEDCSCAISLNEKYANAMQLRAECKKKLGSDNALYDYQLLLGIEDTPLIRQAIENYRAELSQYN